MGGGYWCSCFLHFSFRVDFKGFTVGSRIFRGGVGGRGGGSLTKWGKLCRGGASKKVVYVDPPLWLEATNSSVRGYKENNPAYQRFPSAWLKTLWRHSMTSHPTVLCTRDTHPFSKNIESQEYTIRDRNKVKLLWISQKYTNMMTHTGNGGFLPVDPSMSQYVPNRCNPWGPGALHFCPFWRQANVFLVQCFVVMIYEMTTMVRRTRFVLWGVQLHELMFAVRASSHRPIYYAIATANENMIAILFCRVNRNRNQNCKNRCPTHRNRSCVIIWGVIRPLKVSSHRSMMKPIAKLFFDVCRQSDYPFKLDELWRHFHNRNKSVWTDHKMCLHWIEANTKPIAFQILL